ncbi:MAG TPA: M17 family peptidase N-terminal domain-containing protein [Syntrophales bacterium]|nr:M17 family peptidase N-terminal domain-containing protein [Syntrophales bacterium]HPQ43788.1 M17 family peptidase N-terminal domain-containing protein [Syntrophales bacterium]
MKINVSSESLDVAAYDGLVLGFFSDERPPRGYCGFADWRLNGLISKLIVEGKITGAFMEKTLIFPNHRIPSSKLFLVGLGDSNYLTYEKLYTAGSTISRTLSDAECTDVAFDIPGSSRCKLDVSKMAVAIVSGLFDCGDRKQGHQISEVVVLSDKRYCDEVVLGMHEFKVSMKNRIAVDVINTTASMRM